MSDAAEAPTPLLCSPALRVQPEWIDIYGHMNAARYFTLFTDEGYALMDRLGLGRAYTAGHNAGIFVLEGKIRFLRELTVDALVHLQMRVLEVDRRKLRVCMELIDDLRRITVATLDQLFIHADLGTRKATPFPDAVRDRIACIARAHAQFELPASRPTPFPPSP